MENRARRDKHSPFLFIVMTCLCLCLAFGCAGVREDRHFYFAQITDTHFGHSDHLERTKKIVDQINNLPMKIQCVVHTGDISMDMIEDDVVMAEGSAILNDIKVPIHYVSGNHDIIPERFDTTRQTYIEHLGGLFVAKEYEGVIFIFIYTEPLAESFFVEGYEPLKSLKTALNDAGDIPVIVFHHTPSVEDFYRNAMHEGWEAEVRKAWEETLNAHNVKAVIAGHFHRDEHHWLGDVPLYVSSPVAGYWGRQATFRIYEYKNGKLGYRTQYIE